MKVFSIVNTLDCKACGVLSYYRYYRPDDDAWSQGKEDDGCEVPKGRDSTSTWRSTRAVDDSDDVRLLLGLRAGRRTFLVVGRCRRRQVQSRRKRRPSSLIPRSSPVPSTTSRAISLEKFLFSTTSSNNWS